MPMLARAVFFRAAVMVAICAGGIAPSKAQQIWYAPPDDLKRGSVQEVTDFSQFFTAPQEWPRAAGEIAAFGITPYYIEVAPPEKLKTAIDFLAAHHIAINPGLQALPVDGCGQGIEGNTPSLKQPQAIIARLKQLGADVPYISLDEPLTFGHFYAGKNACKYSIPEVARRLAEAIAMVHETYPAAKIVDFEVATGLPPAQWGPALEQWLDAYHAATGGQFYAVALDSDWHKDWRAAAAVSIPILHRHGVKAAHFVDATGGPTVTDQSWMAEAKQHVGEILAAKLDLDILQIASWMRHPGHDLPESDPLALTSLVDYTAAKLRQR